MPKRFFPEFENFQSGPLRWCFADSSIRNALENLSAGYEELCRKTPSQDASHVSFEYHAPGFPGDRAFVKIYPVRTGKQKFFERMRLKHKQYGRRYGIGEALNTLGARARRIPCPAIYAVGEKRKGLFVHSYVAVLEHLGGYRTLSEFLSMALSGQEKIAVLRRTEKMISLMLERGMFHADLTSRNLMISERGETDDKVVDLEYVKFFSSASPALLAFQLGYLYRKWCGDAVEEPLYDEWAERFFRRIHSSQSDGELPRIYHEAKSRHFSRKEIFSIAGGTHVEDCG